LPAGDRRLAACGRAGVPPVRERVLVSGSSGFIGGYLTGELLRRGYQVVGVDNFSKYGPRPSPHDSDPAFEFVEGDAADASLMGRLLADCDHFIAAAAMVGGISYFHAFPYDLLAANERIMAGSCDAAISAYRQGRLRKLTYVSSSMVYESADTWPSREGQQASVPPPPSVYGFQKLAGEYFVRAAAAQYGLPFTIVRPFNCVGVGESRALRAERTCSGDIKLALSHVVPDLVTKVLKGQDPLRIFGSGRQLRHYTYGGDLARGIVTAMAHPRAAGEDFNLSTAEGTTVAGLAALILAKVKGPGAALRLEHDDPFPGDVQCRVPDTSKARQLLGFAATTSLDQMLDEVIAWMAAALEAGLL
jgi:UDP-glucose 4-epimerase